MTNTHAPVLSRPVRSARLLMVLAVAPLALLMACSSASGWPRDGEGAGGAGMKLAAQEQQRTPAFPQYPSISPDGTVVVFSHAGDLWAVSSGGGLAERITSSPSDEERSCFSPDGTLLAFDSERDGAKNIYTMAVNRNAGGGLVAGDVRRVTVSDRPQTLTGFSSDGKYVYFTSSHEAAIHRSARMYRAAVDAPQGVHGSGGSVMERLSDAFGTQVHATGDGSGILFTRGRVDTTRPVYEGSGAPDVFKLDFKSGAFTAVTSHARSDYDAFSASDGSVVFVSSRDGQNNIWKLKPGAKDADAVQLTSFKPGKGEASIGHGVRDLSVAPGGKFAVFCVWDAVYTLDLRADGAKPVRLDVRVGGDTGMLDYSRTNLSKQVREAALSPDGKTIATAARGEIFVRSTEKDRPTRRVTSTAAKEMELAWSPDGRVLYFASDATGVMAIYAATVEMSREDVAPEPKGDSKEEKKPDAKPDAKEDKKEEGKDDKKDEKKPAEKKKDEGKRWAEAITFSVMPVYVPDGVEAYSPRVSPDGKRMMVTKNLGDLVVVNLDEKGMAVAGSERLVLPSWNESDVQWAADSRHIVYGVEDLNFNSDIWLMDIDAAAGSEEGKPINLTRHPDFDHAPRLSADGKVLVFLSDRDSDSNGRDDVYAVALDKSLDGLRPYELAEYFKDAAEKAKKRKPLSPEKKEEKKDDKKEEKKDAAAGEEKKDEPKKDEGKKDGDEKKPDDKKADDKKDEKKEDKKDAGPSPTKPLKFDADDAWRRVRKVVDLGADAEAGSLQILPGGDRIIFTTGSEAAAAAGGSGPSLVSVDYKGGERKTIATGAASGVSVSLTGEKVVYVSGGEAAIGKPAGGEVEKMAIDAPVVIDVAAQQRQKFLEASRTIGEKFYHPNLKGLDWKALTARYVSLVERTRTDTEFNRIFQNMLGELNGSHLGITGGRSTAGAGEPVGYLGIDAKPAADQSGYEVTRILAGTPADKPALRNSQRLVVGDVITAINGRAFAGKPLIDLRSALAGTVGQETLLAVRSADATVKNIIIVPQGAGAETNARYSDEVKRNTELVEKLSGGKLGYLHIKGMDLPSARDFERDLFAAADGKDGLIIDVRDNGGGFTADILLSSLTAPRHAFTAPRGTDPTAVPKDAYPRDRRLIYGYTRPINVLINHNSFSNAEIFAHSIKTIGRGKLVGTATYGGVISTGAFTLIDGTTVRLPFRGWYLPDGTDMENHGAQPDVNVERTPADEAAGKDAQLEAAVAELLGRVGK